MAAALDVESAEILAGIGGDAVMKGWETSQLGDIAAISYGYRRSRSFWPKNNAKTNT